MVAIVEIMLRNVLLLAASLLSLLCIGVIALGYFVTLDIDQNDVVLANGEEWIDDWYTVTAIDSTTFAIGEPRYWQRNYNYLLLGKERAILFDTGPGVRNIKPVVDKLTNLPVTVVSSHPHYNHIGNNYRSSQNAWPDVEPITPAVEKNIFQPSYTRGFTIRNMPSFEITEWWRPDEQIDIGHRELTLYFVPGHEAASLAIHDPQRKYLFTGDFIYPGWLVGFAPTSDLSDYLDSVRFLIAQINGNETLYGAHSDTEHPSPALPSSALNDLEKALLSIKAGTLEPESKIPIKIYRVNEDMDIYLPPL